MDFYNPRVEVDKTRHKLPRWQQGECPVAITFRLADALPGLKLDEWRHEREAWLSHHPKPWAPEVEAEHHRRFTHRVQSWLDAGHGSCALRAAPIAGILAEELHAHDGDTHDLWAWVVMPNHVHVLTSLRAHVRLPKVVKQWKGASALRINRTLGSTGRLWQPEYFDRLVRSPQHFETSLNYIRDNPAKARLRDGEFLHWERPGLRESMERGL